MALELTQEDWTRFMNPEGLAEKAGVPPHLFPCMILKELADNACDIGGATITAINDDSVRITDTGPGVKLDAFSIRRPLVSSKHWRRGERGALGNGLRAVMGALYVLGGHLVIDTGGTIHKVWIDHNGDAKQEYQGSSDNQGTSITVNCMDIADAVYFADTAIRLQERKVISAGKPSPFWFDEAAIRDLQRSAENVTAAKFVAQFGTRYKPDGGLAVDLDAATLLECMRKDAMKMPKINPLGDVWDGDYAKTVSNFKDGTPVTIEVWAHATTDQMGYVETMTIMNRTQAFQGIQVTVGAKGRLTVSTGGYSYRATTDLRDKLRLRLNVGFEFIISVSAPHIPILSSGKAPDLRDIIVEIMQTVTKAGKKAQAKAGRKVKRMTIASAVNQLLPDAYDRVSEGGKFWANARQLMYAMRPDILRMCNIETFADNTITQTNIPAFIAANPDMTEGWRIAYDNRGNLIEPHSGRSVGLGTIEVHRYTEARSAVTYDWYEESDGLLPNPDPEDRYSGLLFVEKEGFTQLIIEAGILERKDIALASTKGMSVIAARKLIDDMAGRVPNFTLYILSDFDITGQGIAHTLTSDSDRYTFSNSITTKHLGIDWEQAQELHLEGRSEPVSVENRQADAIRLRERGLSEDAVDFLTGTEPRRVEINAMTSAALLEMLENGIDGEKVIPSTNVLAYGWQEMQLRVKLTNLERRLREQDPPKAPDDLADQIEAAFEDDPALSWDAAILKIIEDGEVA